ncbi:hypothetical protein JCM31447_19120 [Fluviispira sanaruensis]|uniref:Cytochrome c assembly protein domain-containing protein n=2 Tax=Fluviispira sanaruensis TaxID=2493639 RepID=A0A4P2VP44_FLUSA|nr:hypothetical protein JCM31447_19120 [Fluviispira sanaruensis]
MEGWGRPFTLNAQSLDNDMQNLTIQENIFRNIFMLETIARIGMSTLYGFAVLIFGYTLMLKSKNAPHSEKFHIGARALFLLATSFTIVYGTLEFIFPVNSLTTQVYTVICFVLSVAVIAVDRGKEGLPAFSFLVGALTFLLATISPFLDPTPLYNAASGDWLVFLHIGTAALGEAIFVASFCASLLYLREYTKLKQKKLEKVHSPISLAALEKLVERSSLIGLTFITISLLSGLALIFIGKVTVQVGIVKILWAFLVWGWYVMTIFGRSLWGWRGRKGARLTVFGMLLLILGFFGTIWQYV